RLICVLMRYPPFSARFPYTTLFRSVSNIDRVLIRAAGEKLHAHFSRQRLKLFDRSRAVDIRTHHHHRLLVSFFQETGQLGHGGRSEEHTSELQSRENLVCRLLLEKK